MTRSWLRGYVARSGPGGAPLEVDPGAVATDEQLADLVDRSVAFVRTLPPKG